MAALPVQDFRDYLLGQSTQTPMVFATQAPSPGGDTIQNSRGMFLVVKNTSGQAVDIAVPEEAKCEHGRTHSLTINVADGIAEPRLVGLFQHSRFSVLSTLVTLVYSATPAGFEVGAVRLF